MKRLLLSATVALAIAGPTFADDACAGFERLAETVVRAKQGGMSMSAAMAIVTDHAGDASSVRVIRALIMDAYRLPDFATDEFKERQVIEFRNAVSSACYRVMLDAGALD